MFGAAKSEKRVAELEKSLERIESSFRKLELEWADTYEKFRRLYMRTCKRVKALEHLEPDEGFAADPELSPPDTQVESRTLLSPKQAEAQRQVEMRRNRTALAARNGGA